MPHCSVRFVLDHSGGPHVLPILLALLPVFLAVFSMIAGNGLITTLVPMRAVLEGFAPTDIGLIGSAYFVGMLAGTWATPAVIRRAGYIRAFAAYSAVVSIATLGFAMAVNPYAWMIFRALIGFCFAGLYAAVESWITVKAGQSRRGRMLGIYNIVHFSGSAAGQQILRVFEAKSFALFSAGAGFLMLSLVPMAMTKAEPPPLPPKGRLVIGPLFRATPIGLFGIILIGLANGTFWSLAPAYIERMNLGPGAVASFMTAVIVGSAVGPYPMGRISDLADRRAVLAIGSMVVALVEAGMVIAGSNFPPLVYVLGFLIGTIAPGLYPIVTAHVMDRMGSERAVAVSSTLLFLYCLGAIVGPTLAAALMARFGEHMLFVHNAVVHVVLALFVGWRITVRERPAPITEASEQVVEAPGQTRT